jgi:hypothetical protein
MAEFGENKNFLADYSNGIIGTNFSAFAAIGALRFIHFRNRDKHRIALGNAGTDKNVGVWLLYIAIQQLHFILFAQGESQTGGYQCLPCATLATGNRDYHSRTILTPHFGQLKL